MACANRILVALCCAPLLASCVFLLDYDELQGGQDSTSPGGAPSGSGGNGNPSAGDGGGGVPGCGECDDGDPCTIDTCDETGDEPTCLNELSEGLKLDGFEQVLESEQHVRVSLVAGKDVFYLSVFEINEQVPDVSLYRLDRQGDALVPLGERIGGALLENGTVVSNVGLAVDPVLGVSVHGFVAVQPAAGPARVFHIESRNGVNTSNPVGTSYSAHSPWVFPQALAMGNSVVGAWIQADGTIAVHELGDVLPRIYGDATLPATTLALLSDSDSQPAVMFTSQLDDGTMGAYVEPGSHVRAGIDECQTAPGAYLSSSVIGTKLPGLWLNNITRVSSDYLTTGGATLACGPLRCEAVTDECDPEQDLTNNVRNVAGATIEADAPGIVYSVIALPHVGVKEGSTTEAEARLSVALGRADFSAEPAQSTTIGGDANGLMEVARLDTGEELEFAGPDWPAVGITPTHEVALAWIQPSAAGTELHVQRYKICAAAD